METNNILEIDDKNNDILSKSEILYRKVLVQKYSVEVILKT
jgi:hypothetical protein